MTIVWLFVARMVLVKKKRKEREKERERNEYVAACSGGPGVLQLRG